MAVRAVIVWWVGGFDVGDGVMSVHTLAHIVEGPRRACGKSRARVGSILVGRRHLEGTVRTVLLGGAIVAVPPKAHVARVSEVLMGRSAFWGGEYSWV